jgi:hypothetical protein
MGFLRRLVRGDSRGRSESERARVQGAVDRIVALSPHLKMARRYQARLEPAVAAAIRYVDGLTSGPAQAREATAQAWPVDPYIHAFFAAPTDIAPALSRSGDLRAFFEQNPDAQEAFGVLGMAMTEKRILGVALEGETMRRDVVQETLSFSDHQVRICARTEAQLREEVVRIMVEQLGLEGLARAAADRDRRGALEQERALLKTRLLLLERQGVGVRAMLGEGGEEGAPSSDELERLHQQVADNEASLAGLGIRTEALDRELDQLCAVLSEPSAHLYVESRRFRLNKMNVVLEESSTEAGDDVTFRVARVPTTPPRLRAFTLVRFGRASLLPATSLLDEAARLLG